MNDDSYAWDDVKAAENRAKHGVGFHLARRVFEDAFGAELLDDREDYGEERWIRIGMVDGTILLVVYTERSGRRRIISARRATKLEQDDYYRQSTSW